MQKKKNYLIRCYLNAAKDVEKQKFSGREFQISGVSGTHGVICEKAPWQIGFFSDV